MSGLSIADLDLSNSKRAKLSACETGWDADTKHWAAFVLSGIGR